MSSFARIFANALARRLAYLLVAAALAWIGVGQARAQVPCTVACSVGANCGQGAAYSDAMAYATCMIPYTGGSGHKAPLVQDHGGGAYYSNVIRDGWAVTGLAIHYYDIAKTCAAQPNYIGPPPVSTGQYRPRSGSLSCISGCEAAMFNNGDGTWTGYYSASGNACTNGTLQEACGTMAGMHWNAYNLTCEPNQSECPENFIQDAATGTCKETCPDGMVVNQNNQCDTPPDSCPPGNVKSPEGGCLPGEGQCAQGEARRENGTCGRDSDGDGQADEDDDDPDNDPDKPSFSGGDNCQNPPSCSGDPILCGQARIQWRIDCNTRRSRKITGGSCAATPICVGEDCDAMEYSSLLMQWRTTCALEKLSLPGAGGGVGGGDDASDWLSANAKANKEEADAIAAGGDGHSGFDIADVWQNNTGDSFNPNLFGGGSPGTCSFDAEMEIAGHEITIPPALFTVLSAVGWLIVAIAYLRVGTLVARSV